MVYKQAYGVRDLSSKNISVPQPRSNGANLGFEDKLWKTADKLRSNMDAAEYKHVVLGLLFLKYISDAFTELHEQLKNDPTSDPEDVDEYVSKRVFWVPKEARWDYLAKNAKKPEIGKVIDDAMDAIERDNRSLRGVLVKNYARPGLDKQRLGELIDVVGTIGLGDKESRTKDVLGRVYEYFLGQFASSEGKKGGQFYTPRSIVRLLVEMLEPYKGRIFDPCCGSGGMFVQSEKFIEAHGGRIGDVFVYGQESNQTTWRLCKMNLAIRGIESDQVKWNGQGSFLNDEHKDLRADFILANPPFNDSDWGGDLLQDDVRWKFGVPPKNNANFAWVQHFIHHLSPTGMAGFVLANGSMASNTSGEGEIRKNIVEADLVDCMVALPPQLFYNTMIPACLWFASRDKKNHKSRNRREHVLFIDARKLGTMVDRRHRELTEVDIRKISDTYHAWRGELKEKNYRDIPGFCKSVPLAEIRKNESILTPGRYVGAAEVPEDTEQFDEKMKLLVAKLHAQIDQGQALDDTIVRNLKELGHGE
jgi:type I restriction enzyme M protein